MLGLVSDQADRASPVTVGLLLEPRSHCAVILKEYRTHATLAMSHGMTLACTRGRGTSVSTTRRSSSAAGTGIRSIALEAEMVISMPSLRRAVRVVDAPEPDSHVGRTRATDADGDVTLAERTADREELQLAPSTGLSMRVAVGFAVYATHEAGTSELTSAHTASHGRSFAPMGAGSRGDRSAAVVTVQRSGANPTVPMTGLQTVPSPAPASEHRRRPDGEAWQRSGPLTLASTYQRPWVELRHATVPRRTAQSRSPSAQRRRPPCTGGPS